MGLLFWYLPERKATVGLGRGRGRNPITTMIHGKECWHPIHEDTGFTYRPAAAASDGLIIQFTGYHLAS